MYWIGSQALLSGRLKPNLNIGASQHSAWLFKQNNTTFHFLLLFTIFTLLLLFLLFSRNTASVYCTHVVSLLLACAFSAVLARTPRPKSYSTPIATCSGFKFFQLLFSGFVFKQDEIGARIAARCARIRLSGIALKVKRQSSS